MVNKKNIVIITDCSDVAFNEMKWIIIQESAKLGFYDLSFELITVQEFSILNAAFLTRLIGEHCLPGTVLSVVINPKRYRSPRIYGKISNGVLFFGANTGALTWLLEDFKVKSLYEIYDPGFVTFGGKFVHAPNIAKLIAGIPFDRFGKKFDVSNIAKLKIPRGTIVHIDNFGLMKIKEDPISYSEGEKFKVFKNGKYILDAVFSERMMSRGDREWVLYSGSSLNSLPELGCVRHKEGYREIGAGIGDVISWRKKN